MDSQIVSVNETPARNNTWNGFGPELPSSSKDLRRYITVLNNYADNTTLQTGAQ